DRETQSLFVVADAREAVFAPAVGSRPRVIVSEVVPGVAVRAVVLAHRAPLALAQVRTPLLPRDPLLARIVQSLLFGDVDDVLDHFGVSCSFQVYGPAAQRASVGPPSVGRGRGAEAELDGQVQPLPPGALVVLLEREDEV